MASYPYVVVTGKIANLFSTIQTSGKPDKISLKWLESVGFKSTNDRQFLSMLKAIGFIDGSGQPTELWIRYRDTSQSKLAMTLALKTTYADLFKLYPNANEKDDEALRNFFRTASGCGEEPVKRMVTTFRALCALADLTSSVENLPPMGGQSPQPQFYTAPGKALTSQPIVININIELALPETKDKETYDNLFSSLKKHLLSPGDKD